MAADPRLDEGAVVTLDEGADEVEEDPCDEETLPRLTFEMVLPV